MLKQVLWRIQFTVVFVCLGSCGLAGQTAAEPEHAHSLTLAQAIAQAEANEPAFAAAQAARDVSRLDRINSRAALLPTATYHNQAIYTQRNGVPASRIGQVTDAPSPIFIANNAVREYVSQGVINETLGLGQIAAIRLADANAARSQAELEIARRGLVNTVVSLYYGVGAGESKLDIAREALAEADRFVVITQERESQREAAHADVLKAQLTQQQRQRELLDAEVYGQKARLELAVLLYPDPATPFTLAPAPAADATQPVDQHTLEPAVLSSNPEILSARAGLQASTATTSAAKAALLPDLALNFTYGIDATNFAVNGPNGIRNLGYAMSAQIDIPIWDWLTTERKIKSARLQERAAKAVLVAAQRRSAANLQEFYAETSAAEKQLASLDTSVSTARESLRLTELRYINGESSVLEVVDAQNTLTAAQNARIDGNTRYRLALANLQTLTGAL